MSRGKIISCNDCGTEITIPYDDHAHTAALKGTPLYLPCDECGGRTYHSG